MRTTELRNEAFDLEDYDKVADLLPTKLENTLNYMYFKWLVDSEKQGISDLSHYLPFLLYFFSIAGFGWYIFISFYTSSILLDDFEHTSWVIQCALTNTLSRNVSLRWAMWSCLLPSSLYVHCHF